VCAWVGHKVGGGASHHVAGGGVDLMPFTGIEAGCADVVDVFEKNMDPAVGARGFRGDSGHVGCSVDGGCDGGL
jgi:hypothetical protein